MNSHRQDLVERQDSVSRRLSGRKLSREVPRKSACLRGLTDQPGSKISPDHAGLLE